MSSPAVIDVEVMPSAKPVDSEFAEFTEKIEPLRELALSLTVTSANDTRIIAQAKAHRLALRELRINVEKRRKDLKEDYLRAGQRIDAAARAIVAIIEPLEARMLAQENFAERLRLEQAHELRTMRAAALSKFGSTFAFDLAELPQAEYETLLRDAEELHAIRLEREQRQRDEAAKAEAERIEREAKLRAENEILRKAAQAEQARADKERAQIAAEQRKVQLAAEATIAAERKKRQDAEDALERQRAMKAAEEKRAAAALRKAARAPDKLKMVAWAKAIDDLSGASFTSPEGKQAAELIRSDLIRIANKAHVLAEQL